MGGWQTGLWGAVLLVLTASAAPAAAVEIVVPPARTGLSSTSKPNVGKLSERRAALGLARGAPIYIRIFKEESALEVWMRQNDRFVLFETYPVCRYDGELGPKLAEGDRQSPEGFYTVSPAQLRWTGRWYRGLDLAFPNVYDTDQGRTGSAILIHGGCSSIGCYAMTNPVIDELFELATEAFDAGQQRIAVHVFPFRMTAANMARHESEAWAGFWNGLRPAYDLFESDRRPPVIGVCDGAYRIETGAAGYDGNLPVARACQRPLATGRSATDASAEPAPKGMGPLRAKLEEFRKFPPLFVDASSGKSARRKGKATIKGGTVVRCSLRLASCRKWVALRQRAKPKAVRAATSKKRKTVAAAP
ncbi:MAG: murein L,D-transpeptidase family protein [Hyphomicrobiaceae bacterium]